MDLFDLSMLVLAVALSPVRSMPIESAMTTEAPVMSEAEMQAYLEYYRYMLPADGDPNSPLGQLQARSIPEAIRAFQRRWNLTETGEADDETRRFMFMPRCGNVDVISPEDTKRRKKRYELQGSKWSTNSLSYQVTAYPADPALTRQTTDSLIARALNVWAEVTPLEFVQKGYDEEADIRVLFGVGYHGDGQPFDGRSGILAHAFYPQYGGDAHFDDAEPWTVGSSSGINLFQVAAHEFGHSLGLEHSQDRDALMAPFYQGYKREFTLHDDDIAGIQGIYGSNTDPDRSHTAPPPVPPPQPTPRPPPGMPNFCADAHFDAVTLHEVNGEKQTYVFQGDYYALIADSGMAPDYPRRINQDWPGLPGNLDTALYWETEYEYSNVNGHYQRSGVRRTGRTYFFKGSMYWRYENMALVSGYPRQIATNWNGLPDDLDAAFVWSGNQRTYFVKGDQYYRYTSLRGVDPGYPRSMNIWADVPWPLDAAVQWRNRKTYFFQGDQYYRFDDSAFQVDSNNYPRSNGYWWLGCTGNNLLHEDDNQRDVDGDQRSEEQNQRSEEQHQRHSSGATAVRSLNLSLTVISIGLYLLR